MRPTILAMMLASGSVPLRGMAEGGRPGLGEPVVVGERGPGGLALYQSVYMAAESLPINLLL
jgi:hypothetical protein